MNTRWRRFVTYLALPCAWAVFAAWQYQEYGRERQLARETLHRQAHSIMQALVGGIKSHRRMGYFVSQQLQGILDQLVKSQSVLAVAIQSDDGRVALSAGSSDLLDPARPAAAGNYWHESGFQLVEQLEIQPDPGGSFGPGRGRRGSFSGAGRPEEQSEPLSRRFTAGLLLDRSGTDVVCRNAARLRGVVAIAGGVVLICVALAWRATVRLVEARGQTRVLETKTRHLRELSQAAAGLAHETRNPLGLIRGCTQQLSRSENLSVEQKKQVQAVVEECDRVTARINQFLAFARPHEPKPETIDPDQLVDELTTLLQPDLDAKQLRLHHPRLPTPRKVTADREMLRQALFNLLQNAIDFSPEGAAVDVEVNKGQDGFCRIDVADRGPGVGHDDVASLFTPYFTTRSGGTGLGLAIVRQLATSHGWLVDYQPRLRGGAIFRIDQIRGQTTTNDPRGGR